MASYQVVSTVPPYHTVKVAFSDMEFTQPLYSTKTGAALNNQFQAYADEYEADWVAPVVEDPT